MPNMSKSRSAAAAAPPTGPKPWSTRPEASIRSGGVLYPDPPPPRPPPPAPR